MNRRRRIFGALAALMVAAAVALALLLSHDSACTPATPLPAGTTPMKAIVYRCYGAPAVLRVEDVAKLQPADDQVLVKVRAAALNPLDWHYLRGQPYVMRLSSGLGRPTDPRLGVDFAGTVEAVGRSVQRFKPGDEVFGGANGALGEYILVRENRAIALKPPNVGFDEAAAVPIAAITALQALRDKARLKPGQRVLVNGASGGVGIFAVQIAKAMGAQVTGVSSTRNLALVQALGADQVIDYTRQDFTRSEMRYDVIVDNVGNHPLLAYRRVLRDTGVVEMIGGPSEDPWLGPLGRVLGAGLLSPFVKPRFEMLLADMNPSDLETLRGMMAAGTLRSVIDRRYSLADTAAAIAYLETGRARGKVIIEVAGPQ